MDTVSLIKMDNACYPGEQDLWAPECEYPEFAQGGVISGNKNNPYHMFREALISLELDLPNVGTDKWNPLGEFIVPGNKVVIKPNLVKHNNPNGSMECLVTNVSLIRAVIDYVLIALKGEGSIIVGDAPVQTCDFENLIDSYGYKKLVDYYKKQGVQIELKDFRCTVSSIDKNGHLHQNNVKERLENSVVVNLGTDSAHYAQENESKLRITNYPKDELTAHHRGETHEYLISKDVLEADVIINMPKPKTHRKAGVTGALKNMVGISAKKEYLPHHKRGSKPNGGDEYPLPDWNQSLRTILSEKIADANSKEQFAKSTILGKTSFAIYAVKRILKGKEARTEIGEGSWSGNDTIWRTINDLNKIVFYSDADGNMHESPQRKMLVIADMIVTGEGEGPLLPTPRQMNQLIVGTNPCEVDKLIVKTFGLDEAKIPSVHNCEFGTKFRLKAADSIIKSNDEYLNNKKVSDVDYSIYERVKMPNGWKDI